jgi:hypothetical protein
MRSDGSGGNLGSFADFIWRKERDYQYYGGSFG